MDLLADARAPTSVIRATGSRVPVVCIASSPGHHDSFADATIEQDSSELLTDLGELLKTMARFEIAASPRSIPV